MKMTPQMNTLIHPSIKILIQMRNNQILNITTQGPIIHVIMLPNSDTNRKKKPRYHKTRSRKPNCTDLVLNLSSLFYYYFSLFYPVYFVVFLSRQTESVPDHKFHSGYVIHRWLITDRGHFISHLHQTQE